MRIRAASTSARSNSRLRMSLPQVLVLAFGVISRGPVRWVKPLTDGEQRLPWLPVAARYS